MGNIMFWVESVEIIADIKEDIEMLLSEIRVWNKIFI